MMTAGTYIRLARERRDLSLEDVATRLDSDPHVPTRRRIDWLAAIEADRETVTEHVAFALADVLGLDVVTLSRLQAIATGTGVSTSACLHELPDGVLSMSNAALLRHTGQPQTFVGLARAAAIARAAGWVWEVPGQWRRPVLIAEPRP